MITPQNTKKYNNLLWNSSVDLPIDDRADGSPDEAPCTLTLTGTCAPMVRSEAKKCMRQAIAQRRPHLDPHFSGKDGFRLERETKKFAVSA